MKTVNNTTELKDEIQSLVDEQDEKDYQEDLESTNPFKKPISQVQIRAKVQTLIEDNMQHANGRFHCKELNEYGFLQDLFKKFTLTPKQ